MGGSVSSDVFNLEVDAAERIGALGKTGSGKTFLMKRLLLQVSGLCVIVVDTKHSIELFGFKLFQEA